MLEMLKNEANRTYTENGAVTYATTFCDCLDLFATIGALRSSNEQEIISRFVRAFTENPDLAILKVDGKGTPVKVASEIAAVGTDAYTIGAPLGIFPTFSSGMVMNNTFSENGISFYLTSTFFST